MSSFPKAAPPEAVAHERAVLRLVQGDGIVPLDETDSPPADRLTLARATCSIADVLDERGRLHAAEARGVAIAAAHALARVHAVGLVHGDVKPSNLLLSDDSDVWLADFDAAGAVGTPRRRHSPGRHHGDDTLQIHDDVVALVGTVVECAVGLPLDLGQSWDSMQLIGLGCPADLAAELALALRRPPDALALAAALDSAPSRLPAPTTATGADRTPTVEFSPGGPR